MRLPHSLWPKFRLLIQSLLATVAILCLVIILTATYLMVWYEFKIDMLLISLFKTISIENFVTNAQTYFPFYLSKKKLTYLKGGEIESSTH